MSWSDYINTENVRLTKAQTGLDALVKAVKERLDVTCSDDYYKIDEIKKLTNIESTSIRDTWYYNTVFNQVNRAIEWLCSCRQFVKPPVFENLLFYEPEQYYADATWQNIAEICEYLGEKEIKWFIPLNAKFPAEWFEQRVKILNLLTVVRCVSSVLDVKFECEKIDTHCYLGTSSSYDDALNGLIENSSNYLKSDNYFRIQSYCCKRNYYAWCGGYDYMWSRRCDIASERARFYFDNENVKKTFKLSAVAKASSLLWGSDSERSSHIFDAGSTDWIANQTFLLKQIMVKNGVSPKSEWFGYSSYFPLPLPAPGELIYNSDPLLCDAPASTRGFNLDCAFIADFTVPGGFEFVEKS